MAYVITIGLTLVLSRRLGLAHRTALVAAVLVALAPLTVWYAQEARMNLSRLEVRRYTRGAATR